MPSGYSGFQGLSQAALSRSRFLWLAAGALLPFVGWRPSTAAAANHELAQKSDRPATKDASAPGRMGAILVSQFGPVKIHSYLSPLDGFHVNTQMIEGPTAVVIFDGQLLLPYANEVASYLHTLGKPVERIILSHAHTDHWSGLQVLTERFPHARVFALDGIADQLRARGQARLDSFRPIYGDRIATEVTVPTEIITEGVQLIDGITYDFKRFVDAESDLQLAALLPEQKVLMAFDLVFSPNEHVFPLATIFRRRALSARCALSHAYQTNDIALYSLSRLLDNAPRVVTPQLVDRMQSPSQRSPHLVQASGPSRCGLA